MQRGESARVVQPAEPQSVQDLLSHLVGNFSVLVRQKPHVVQFENERAPLRGRYRRFVFHFENYVVRGNIAAAEIVEFHPFPLARHAQDALARRKLPRQAQDMFANLLDRAAYALRRHREAGIVLVDQQLQARRARHVRAV